MQHLRHFDEESEKKSKGWFKYPKETILKTLIHKISGYRYLINKNGFIVRNKRGGGGDPCPTCGKTLKGTTCKEIVELPNFDKSQYPIKKDPGWLYYLSVEGNICRVKWLGSPSFFKAVFKVEPSPEEKAYLEKAMSIRRSLRDQAALVSVSLAEEYLKTQKTQRDKELKETKSFL